MRFRNYILESLSTAEKYYTMSIDDMLNDVRGRPLVFFDCETSGLDPYLPHVQITEIGGVAVFPNGQKRSFHKKEVQPGVCPGVGIALIFSSPNIKISPS